MTKTTVDKSITTVLILYSMVFLMPLLMNKNLWDSKIWIFLLFLGSVLIIMGVWKYEYYKYDKIQIKKYNFAGLFSRKYRLIEITSYKNRFINIGYSKNPMAILSFFRKDSKKFIEFNLLQVIFYNNTKLKIDERVMSNQDFIKIKNLIKNSKLHKKL
jgi:hypothetical protein